MRLTKITSAAWIMAAAFTLGTVGLSAASASFTGKVSDSMCGADHHGKDPATCTRGCVKNGADYALVVKDKVYILKESAKLKAELNKLAGANATVTGTLKGTTITVSKVVAAK